MSLIRPELWRSVQRGREVLLGAALVVAGGWVASGGGYVLVPIGLGLAGLGLAWAVTAWRRMQFAQGIAAPGIVEIDEAQIGYLGPDAGGYVAIPDLTELRLLDMRGRRLWQLRQGDGQVLLIPVDATGADRLFDAFASLPGMDTAVLVAALAPPQPDARRSPALATVSTTLWRRGGRHAVLRRGDP
ncbi:MAG: hypothetical protein V4516_02420 [Pseudomonadota bacterium]